MYLRQQECNNVVNCTDSTFKQCNFNVTGFNNKIDIADSVDFRSMLGIFIEGIGNSITIEDDVVIRGLNINIDASNCNVTIGKNTSFEGTFISLGDENSFLQIGEDCMFAGQTGILVSDFHPIIDLTTHERINPVPYAQHGVTLGSHVWVGFNAMILKDVTIGNNSVIGAKALVAKDIPSNTVAAGNPAKVIRNNIDWCRIGNLHDSYPVIDMDTSEFEQTTDVESYLERFDDLGYLQGWAFIKDLESGFQKIYVEAKYLDKKRKLYISSIFKRPDVVSAFNDSKYKWSGFECKIDDHENLQELNLLIVNGDCKRYKQLKW